MVSTRFHSAPQQISHAAPASAEISKSVSKPTRQRGIGISIMVKALLYHARAY
jgi:hypothetical protein